MCSHTVRGYDLAVPEPQYTEALPHCQRVCCILSSVL